MKAKLPAPSPVNSGEPVDGGDRLLPESPLMAQCVFLVGAGKVVDGKEKSTQNSRERCLIASENTAAFMAAVMGKWRLLAVWM